MSQMIGELLEDLIASFDDLHQVVPDCEKGIGSVILAADSPPLMACGCSRCRSGRMTVAISTRSCGPASDRPQATA